MLLGKSLMEYLKQKLVYLIYRYYKDQQKTVLGLKENSDIKI